MSSADAGASGCLVAAVIARRELVRFFRQPARVAASIGTPLLLWAFMGSGFAGGFRPSGLSETTYAAFLLPGAMTLVAVFASIFSSISVIEDRNEGWLQAALASPAPRWALALGKVAGASVVAFAQASVLMLAAPLLVANLTVSAIGLSLLALAATTFAMSALGFLFAWRCETTASFHAVMNMVFMPMWLLSGAFFPPNAAQGPAPWLASIMRLNPLTWCTQAIRQPLVSGRMSDADWWWLLAAGLFAVVMLGAAIATVARRARLP